jgi:hypothetical protein
MTGINASKIIQNLELLHSFAVSISLASAALASSVEAIDFKVGTRKTENLRCFFVRIFIFLKSGPVQTGRPPLVGGGGWQLESLPAFNGTPESSDGTLG